MTEKRNITYKYKNFEYNDVTKKLLDVNLTQTDKKKLHKVYSNFYDLNAERGYEYIIEDIFKFVSKHKLTSSQIAEIYDVNVRTVQIWLKELGLNRDLKNAKKISKKAPDINLSSASPLSSSSTNRFGIEVFSDEQIPSSIRDFLNYLETIKGKSPNTIEGYKIDLTIFFRFLKVFKGAYIPPNLEFDEIPINDIDTAFLNNIVLTDLYTYLTFVEKQRGNGTYARARKVATLKSFFKFLHGKAKILKDNPTLELESPKINKRQPVYLTLDESLEVINSLDKENKNYERDYCILMFFLNCGMRLSELCTIRLDKIKEDTLTIIGKGNKERTVYLNETCLDALSSYLSVRDDSKATLEDKKYLFLSSRAKPINKRTVELLVKKHVKNANIREGKFTPHKLRHTAATLMYKHGNVDIRSLQSILGHENISTTQIYTHVDDETLREAVKSNPLGKLK